MGDWFKMEDSEYDRKFASQEETQAREEFEFFKPSLRNRLEYIVETGRKWEWREEVEDINFYLEVMEDPLMMRTHGVTGIRSFVTEIHNIENKNPIPNDWKPRNSGQGETLPNNKYASKSSAYVFEDWDEDKKQEFEKWKNSSETQSWGEQQNLFQPSSSSSTSTGQNSAREESTNYEPMYSNYERSRTLPNDPIEEDDFSHLYERRPRTELTDSSNSRSEPRRDLSRERNASESAFSNTSRQDTDLRPNSYQRTGNEWSLRSGSESHSFSEPRQSVGSSREQPFSRIPPVIQQPLPMQMTYNNAPSFPPQPPRCFVPTFMPVPVPVHMPYYQFPVSNIHRPPLNQDNPYPQRDFTRDRSNHEQFSHSANIRNQKYPTRQDNPHRVPHHPERAPQQSHRLPQHSERVPHHPERVPHHPERVPHHPERVPHHPERVPQQPHRVPQHRERFPQQSHRVPNHPEPVPQHRERVPQQSHRVPHPPEPVPQYSERVPQQPYHVSQPSERVPQQSERVPQHSERVPHHPERVPHHPERVPHHPERVPHHPERVPQQPHRVPQHRERFPQQSHRVPNHPEPVPQHRERVPQQSHRVPHPPEPVPQYSERVPQQPYHVSQPSERVPQQSERVPQHSERVPQQPHRVPQHRERVPQQSHRVPHPPEPVPQYSERVPKQPYHVSQPSERVPQKSERVPQHSERVPQQPHRVPQHRERVPQQSHHVPQQSHRVPQQSHHAPTVVNERSARPAIPQPTATLFNSSHDLLRIKEIARMKAKQCFNNRQKNWENSKGRNSTFSKTTTRVEHPSTSKRTEYESRKRSGENPKEIAIQEKRKKDYPVQHLEESSSQVQANPPTSTGVLVPSPVDIEPELEIYGEFEYGTTKISEKTKEIKVEKEVTTPVEENEVNVATQTSAAAILTLLKSRKRSETIPNEVVIPENHKKTEKTKGISAEMDVIPEVEKEIEHQNDNFRAATASTSISLVPEVVIKSEFSETTNEVQTDTQHSQNVIADEHQQVVEPTTGQEIVTEEYHDSNENQQDSTESLQDSPENQQESTENQQDSTENQRDLTERQPESTDNQRDLPESLPESTENQLDLPESLPESTENQLDLPENQKDSTENLMDLPENQQDSTENQLDLPENQPESTENPQDVVENQEESPGIINEIYENRVTSNHSEVQMNEHFETTHQELQLQQHEVVNRSDNSSDARSLEFSGNCTSIADPNQGDSPASITKQPTGKRGRPKGKKATKQASASNSKSSSSPQASSSSNTGEQRYSLRNTAKRKQYQNKEAATEPRVMCRLNVIEMDKVCDTESRKKLWEQSMKKFASKTLENGRIFIGRNDIHTRAGLSKIKVEADYIPPPPSEVKLEPGSVVEPEEDDDNYSD